MLTMVDTTTGWLETYPVLHATIWNTILGLETKSYGNIAPPKEMSQTTGLTFVTAS